MPVSFTLHRALLGTIVAALLAGLVPAAVLLDRRLASALEDRARNDLALAPRVLADRVAANSDVMMMHAKDLAHSAGLGIALVAGDRMKARAVLDAARPTLGGEPVLVGPAGETWAGLRVDSSLIARTKAGEMPVVVRRTGAIVDYVALAPVTRGERWVGAAGLAAPFDEHLAGILSGITRAGVVLIADEVGPVATTVDSMIARALAAQVVTGALTETPRELSLNGDRFIAVAVPLPGAGTVVFTRALSEELAVLPDLRRTAALAAAAALLLAGVLGAALAARTSRPVQQLAAAATDLARGDFSAPLPASRIREVARVATSFAAMRESLAARLAELGAANAELTDRNARLTALQTDLVQRERQAATGRLVVQLAHEIRNPVAGLRNCLELIRRRVTHDAEALQFADLAIDELLRMHELAEQMLELNRPRGVQAAVCRPVQLSRDVARLESLGNHDGVPTITVNGDDDIVAAMAPDAFKQIILNLLQNSREASKGEHSAAIAIDVAALERIVLVDVRDRGPGIPADILPRIFDPFFTTKSATRGVGLGLFVADGLVRAVGGRISARDGGDADAAAAGATPHSATATGAWFRLELPRVQTAMEADA